MTRPLTSPVLSSPWKRPLMLGGLLLGLLLINSLITQHIAAGFDYSPALGSPLIGRFYWPWQWLTWQAHFYTLAPHSFMLAYLVFIASLGLAILVFCLLEGIRAHRRQRHEGVHGTAHFASEDEIRATGLIPPAGKQGSGVYVGGWKDDKGRLHYLRHDGPEHIIALAPTRSGKGVGLVLPTLLSWPHSVVINDIKGELWNLTAGWRKKSANNVVLKFDPAAEVGSIAYNPLAEIRLGTPYEVGDVQNSVTILVDPDGKGLTDHWAKTAHALLTGVILHLLYQHQQAGTVATLEKLALSLSDPHQPIDKLYEAMLANTHQDGKTHPVVAAAARDMLNRPETERGSVLSSAMSYLSLYRDPLVAKNTRHSDFKITDLMNHSKPVSLYLVVKPSDKDRLKPLMRLLLNQIVRVLVREEMRFDKGRALPVHRQRLLLQLDEFASFGRLDVFQESLAYIAGFGIKAYLIVQDISQLWAAYGHDESIISNCHVRVVYAPNKVETAEWISKTLGTTTIIKEDVSTSGQRFGAVLQQVSKSFHEVSRPLLTPDECMRLKSPTKNAAGTQIEEAGDILVFVAGHAPIYGTQSLYFQDPIFNDRSKMNAPPTDTHATFTEDTPEFVA